jgi:hypothetical protein
MLTKVNPAHVVAVPVDYNNQKLRVCEALILREVAKEYVSTLFVREDHIVTEDGWIEDEDYPVAEWRDAVAAVINGDTELSFQSGSANSNFTHPIIFELRSRAAREGGPFDSNAFQLHARIAQQKDRPHPGRHRLQGYLPLHLPVDGQRLLCRAWAARAAVGEVQAHIG